MAQHPPSDGDPQTIAPNWRKNSNFMPVSFKNIGINHA
jgi:hypothetical protein